MQIISVSVLRSIPDCHSGDHGLMPRQRELFRSSSLNRVWSAYKELKSQARKKGHSRQTQNNDNNTLKTLLQKLQNAHKSTH